MISLANRLMAIARTTETWLAAPALLALRVALAIPFFRSGLTKWEAPFVLSSGAKYLFTEEFRLHLGFADIPYPAPLLMAFLAGAGEIVLPILLILGLATRLSALGILAMTLVIQLTIPDGLLNFHLPWAAMALSLLAYGGGLFSADRLVGGVLTRRVAGGMQVN
jgi:putative oxidoreductase